MKKNKILGLLSLSLLFSSCSLRGKEFPLEAYIHKMNYHDNFKIVQLTDLHFSSYDDLDEDFKFIDLMYKEQSDVDLVILSGDLFTFASKKTIKSVLSYFDSKNIPWSVTFGNHDEQVFANHSYVSEQISKMNNSVYTHIDDDINGITNTIINLVDGVTTKYQIYLIDSNTYTFKGDPGYDCVHEDQIEFYKKQVELANKERFGEEWKVGDEAINSLIFQHIPLPEIQIALKDYSIPSEMENGEQYNEKSCPPKVNSGFFDVIKEYKSTKAVITGHDHKNDFKLNYQGIDFIYGVKSTDNMYNDKDMLGYRLITLVSENNYSTRNYFHTYDEVK